MIVFVDTSVWIDFFRGRTPAIRDALSELLDDDRVALAAPVRVELLGGVRKGEAARLKRLLGAIASFLPTDATWDAMDAWAVRGAERGERFGVADLLIGAIATDHAGAIWSLDDDFRRMAKLGFVTLHDPAGG